MDFYRIRERATKNGVVEVYPDYQITQSRDLMVKGKSFYAIWDSEKGLWSTNEYDLQRLVDKELHDYSVEAEKRLDGRVYTKYLGDFSSKSWMEYRSWVGHISDSAVPLDENLTFADTPARKELYASKRLPYSLEDGECPAFEEIISTLYEPEERAKLEWAIGSVVAGDSKDIQKFIVLYGPAGAGKSTILNIIQKLFVGYYAVFDAKALAGSNNAFATEVFRTNPLVAIQHDGDLSRIEDNTKLNSIISHEEMTMNEKFKPTYASRVNAFLFMGTNKPVKITDAKSGIIRRLIDVTPSGNQIQTRRYFVLMDKIDTELGAIAKHCLDVYLSMGKNYYNSYRPISMMFKTDVFYNFVEDSYYDFLEADGVTLKRAYDMYKEYCESSLIDHKLPKHIFREELRNYFAEYYERYHSGESNIRHYYKGFLSEKFEKGEQVAEPISPYSLVLDQTESLLDKLYSNCPAQYATSNGTPFMKWSDVVTKLSDLDTRKEHYVKPPENHIVIDFDLKDDEGNKSAERNLQAACKFPPTYAEYSKGGSGIHLHYVYDGDPSELSMVYSEDIEVKVFKGNASLRRRVSLSNSLPIATISSGLPLKEKKMINNDRVKSEKALRGLVLRNLRKEIHPGTKPSVDFIKKILDDAYSDGLEYDLTDLRPKIMAFANNSTHHAEYCLRMVTLMHFKSEDKEFEDPAEFAEDSKLVFFDCEVFPNLFLINWMFDGSNEVVRMINPTPEEIEKLFSMKLVGFNNRKYDNHILYGRYMGYSNKELFDLSTRIINNSPNSTFAEAYNISYTDVYDYANTKMSLKKWEIKLGIHHKELGLPWDEPVPEDRWIEVAEYCDNDVIATAAVHNHLKEDWVARQVLASLSGLTVNHTTNAHTTRIVFGEDKHPQSEFVYTDLSETFPGYKYEFGKSSYRGEDPGEGGYVYSEPGMYNNVCLLDVASEHPSSIVALNLFGDKYTKRFENLLNSRIAIKHGDIDTADALLQGKLKPVLDDLRKRGLDIDNKAMAYALKIPINSVYGLTAAKFDNKFRDPRNVDNIVAKRGALFMIDLKHFVQEQGFTVAHIKTDSIKIPDATPEIIEKVIAFGKKYGYTFEHEATYDRMCLVNDAVYIAHDKDGWHATGAQFQHPVVFKTLFSKEQITFDDYCETKTVQTALYLDMNEGLDDDCHNYTFVGKAGLFVPVLPGVGGGLLVREREGGYSSATGTKGYRWLEAESVKVLNLQDKIDKSYSRKLVDAAVETIDKFGDFNEFASV